MLHLNILQICPNILRFSVGSGRPPVISSQYFDQCAKILEFPSYNTRDELVLSGVHLYRTLWELISSNMIEKEDPVWPDIEQLRKSQEHIYSKVQLTKEKVTCAVNNLNFFSYRPRLIRTLTIRLLLRLPHSRSPHPAAHPRVPPRKNRLEIVTRIERHKIHQIRHTPCHRNPKPIPLDVRPHSLHSSRLREPALLLCYGHYGGVRCSCAECHGYTQPHGASYFSYPAWWQGRAGE